MMNLKKRIYEEFKEKGMLKAFDLMTLFQVTRPAIHRHLQALLREGAILKLGSGRRNTSYILNAPALLRKYFGKVRTFRKHLRAFNLSEDAVAREIEEKMRLKEVLEHDALTNVRYAFTEMLNNAIDHSGTVFIEIDFNVDSNSCSFVVRDTGIGVFANIMSKHGLTSEMEGIEDLLKGKQTTMPERHSGEGIFFTSKVADRFFLESHRKRLIVDNRIGDVFVEDRRFLKGTRVTFEIDAASKKKLSELFSEYTSESFDFDRTKVTVKLFESGDSYISRSQAKRLVHTLDRFREIVLDFSGIETVGQAFADEVFRVFQTAHPNIRIVPINMNENVEFMVGRAQR